MGLSIAIAGSISVAAMFLIMTVIPGATDKFVDSIEVRSDVKNIQKKIDDTQLQIASINAIAGDDVFSFNLTNTGTQKAWNFDKFDFLITYDADVSGTKTRLVEVFTYNETASFQGVLITQFGRPTQDIAEGGWTTTPLYEKLNETARDDSTFITSPTIVISPANNVTVKLSSVIDPDTSYGHFLNYTYKSDLITTNTGLVGYGELGATNSRYREWTGTSFTAEGSVNQPIPLVGNPQWVVIKSSPIKNEKIMAFVSQTTNILWVKTFDGTSWTSNWSTVLGNSDTRRFDIAYEADSGDAIIVFGDSTSTLKYRTRIAGTWSLVDQNVGTALDNVPLHVVAKSRPSSDDIFVGVVTNQGSQGTLYGMRWNGNGWDNRVTTTTAPNDKAYPTFDIAFERSTGDAFLLWGDNNKNLLYREFTTSWGTEQTAYSSLDHNLRWIVADYNRQNANSNEIVVGMQTQNGKLEFGAWTGSSWVTRPASVNAQDSNNRGISTGFDKSNNKAMFVFVTNTAGNQMSWRTWTNTGGFSSVTAESGTSGNIKWIQLRPDPLTNKMMTLYNDVNNDLFHRHWDGSSWSSLGTALEDNLSTSGDNREPFMFSWFNVVFVTLKVQLLQGSTVIAEWDEDNIFGIDWTEKERLLTTSEANAITDYSDLQISYVGDGNELKWSYAVLKVSYFPGDANEWGVNGMGEDSYDPRILNPGETAIVFGQLPYPPYLDGTFTVTVSADGVLIVLFLIQLSKKF